jgi:hypothetical protein
LEGHTVKFILCVRACVCVCSGGVVVVRLHVCEWLDDKVTLLVLGKTRGVEIEIIQSKGI